MKEKYRVLFVFILAILLMACQAPAGSNTSSSSMPVMEDGIQKTYHSNGRVKTEGLYKNGKKEGLHKEWYDTGLLSAKGMYKNGQEHGRMQWYNESGELVGNGNIFNGLREGEWRIYDVHDPRISVVGQFENGKEEGSWKTHHPNGLVGRENIYHKGEIQYTKCWDKNGDVIDCKVEK